MGIFKGNCNSAAARPFIRAYFIQAFKIPSGSMIPTLVVGDHILVNKFIYGTNIPFSDKRILELKKPSRGDIIVFKYPKTLKGIL